jgi:hypothetical protein
VDLPAVVDQFLTAIGITVLEGYGMTETSAVISIRRLNKPTPGTVGTPIPGYEVCLKDDKGNLVTEIGQKGSLWVKSKQILMGYYKRPELNQSIFDKNGFFDTGDIMRLNHRGELSFAGRVKDFIGLGELMARDALNRNESCGGHFREEYQTEEGEAKRDDANFAYVGAWEYKGENQQQELHKEELKFDVVHLTQRSYK